MNGGAGANGRVILTYTPCSGPIVSVLPSAPSICSGSSIVLTASGASAGYTWSPAIGLSGTSGAVVTANPTTTTTYTLTGTNTGCSITGSATVTVTVDEAPTAPVMSPTSVTTCSGSSTVLGAASSTNATLSSSPFNSTGGPATTTTGAAQNASIYPWNISVSGLPTTGVTVESVTINGITHTFPDDLDILLQSPTGTNVILMSDAGAGDNITGLTYTFKDGEVSLQDAVTNPSGTYSPSNYTGTGDETWSAPGPGGLTQPSPALSMFTGNVNGVWKLLIRDDETGDAGSIGSWSITFTIPATVSYTWSPNVALSSTTGPSVTASPTSDQSYTVTVSHNANGCTSQGTVVVTAVALPDAGSNGTMAICSNGAAIGLLSQLGGSPDVGGTWSGPSAVISGLYDPLTMDPGTYTYTVTAAPCTNATADVVVSENMATAWYADDDGDGFGDVGDVLMACSPPVGYVANNTDCNDSQITYADADGDGFGAGAPTPCGVANNSDCNDSAILHADVDGDGFGAAANAPCGIADNSDCDDMQFLYVDGDGDGYGTGVPVACGVPNNTDCNDTQILYADTDGDGYGAGAPAACGVTNNGDNCPNIVGLQGDYCDVNNGSGPFLFGQINGSCQCVAVPCTETVTMELRTDALSSQASWQILLQGTNQVVCQFSIPINGITSPITDNCCLPVGCYRLRVNDSGGDGFVSGGITGGYQLRESGPTGSRIIDNLGNFTSGSTSALSSTYGDGAFCVPVGSDRPIFSSCDKMDWVNDKFIVATENTAVSAQYGITNTTSGYQFWFFDPNGTYSYRRFRNHATSDGFGSGALRANHFRVNGWSNTMTTPHIPSDILLNVRIRGRVAGVDQPFGPACLFKIDAVRAAAPLVKLQDNPLSNDFSCGVTKVFGGSNSAANRITVNPPQPVPAVSSGNVRYQFRFRLPGEVPNPGSCIVRPMQTSPTLYLNWATGDKLKCNTQYEVDVRASLDGGLTWNIANAEAECDPNPTPWGKVCMVNISSSTYCPGSLQGSSSSMAQQTNGDLTMYPNPNRGEQLFINLSSVESNVNTVSVDIYDLTGKRVVARTIAVNEGFVKTTLDLNGDLNSGMYLVNVTSGSKTYTERLVIQK